MDESERDIRAEQHKDRVDLATSHEKEWAKFQQKKDEYIQRYGPGYGKILLSKERTALETKFNLEIQQMNDYHGEQWLGHFNGEPTSMDKPYSLPDYLKPPESAKDQIEQEPQPSQNQPSRPLLHNPANGPNQDPDKYINTLDPSQKRMNQKLLEHKQKQEKEDGSPKTQMSMSQRFTQGLSSSRVADNTDNVAKGKNVEKDKGPEKD